MDQESTIDLICISQSERVEKQEKVSIQSFNLLTVLGKGSYAKVVLVRKKDNGKVYALKMLKKAYIKKQQQIEHITTERAILTECHHPFIIKLAYAFQTEEKLYFCLEYCPGGELYNLLQNQLKLSEEQTRFFAAQIILALDYLHSKDIVYRDLKPENVLIGRDGFIKLTDFGLSKIGIQGNEGAKSRCGTPEYLAPEILIGNHGKAVDWWTLGSIIYEMVAGEPPFYGKTREDLFTRIQTQPVRLLSCFSKNLKDLLSKLFIKDPNQRLGGQNGASEIKSHVWFKNCNWDDYMKKSVKPFFIPHLNNDTDVSHFDKMFVNEPILSNPSSVAQSQITKVDRIEDFSYQQASPMTSPPQSRKLITTDNKQASPNSVDAFSLKMDESSSSIEVQFT